VAGGLVELELADVRREDLRVALLAQLAADEVCSSWRRMEPLGVQRIRPWPTSSSMWKSFSSGRACGGRGLGLLELLEVLGEFLLGREGGAVDALELLVLLVAAVIGAGDGEELEGFQLGGVAHVRAGAEVGMNSPFW
jgi:hypothetical protein